MTTLRNRVMSNWVLRELCENSGQMRNLGFIEESGWVRNWVSYETCEAPSVKRVRETRETCLIPCATSRVIPSPARSIRPSLDCAIAWPCSAARVDQYAPCSASRAYPCRPSWCSSPKASCASALPAIASALYQGESPLSHAGPPPGTSQKTAE